MAERIEDMECNYTDLKGKTALITGAARGIGEGIARVLGAQGMKLVLTARSDNEGLAVREDLIARGMDVTWIPSDLTRMDEACKVLNACPGTPYLLVNNAAMMHSKPILEFDEEEMAHSLLGNLKILHHITYLAVNRMKDAGGGVVINISSVGGQRAHRGLCGYDSYKGAMDSFTRSCAMDLASCSIRVNGVAPGATAVRDNQPLTNKRTPGIPLGRMGMREEIGHAVAFLASDNAAYITGQTLTVDGGLTAQLTPPGIFI